MVLELNLKENERCNVNIKQVMQLENCCHFVCLLRETLFREGSIY
jgi:hypothetical protein